VSESQEFVPSAPRPHRHWLERRSIVLGVGVALGLSTYYFTGEPPTRNAATSEVAPSIPGESIPEAAIPEESIPDASIPEVSIPEAALEADIATAAALLESENAATVPASADLALAPDAAAPRAAEPAVDIAATSPELLAARGLAALSEAKRAALDQRPPVALDEVWAYLYRGEEKHWRAELPITDLCLFNYSLDDTGEIQGSVDPKFIATLASHGVRSHVVVAASGSKALFHFLLEPRYPHRERLLDGLIRIASTSRADGFQLDFEGLRKEDGPHLAEFVRELRRRLPPGRIFSVALPAKVRDTDHAYMYREWGELADRLFLMVYDFHWGGGEPGAVSPRDWHDRVIEHALATLPREKIVVGLPFYGRVWQHESVARAIRHGQVDAYADRAEWRFDYDVDASHRFTFIEQVRGEGWFDDAASLYRKLESVRAAGLSKAGFWRLGQEDAAIWSLIDAPRARRR
jgi:spore germination protein